MSSCAFGNKVETPWWDLSWKIGAGLAEILRDDEGKMKALKVLPLVIGILLYANAAYGMTLPAAAGAAAAIGAGLEAITQTVAQINSVSAWASGNNLTSEQVKEVQAAIDYMKSKGFVNEAKQAQTMLNNSQSWVWRKLGSTYVVKEGKSGDMAETFGGSSNAIFNNGHTVLYDNFFKVPKHDGIAIDTPEKRTRDQALTLIHELEHKNTQTDVININLINALRGYDTERGPLTKTADTLAGLGYTPKEIETIRTTWANGPYKKYVNLIDKAVAKSEPPKTDEPTIPKADEPAAPSPAPEQKGDRPQKKMAETKGRRQSDTDETRPSKTKEPPREKSDSGDQSDTPVDPYVKGPTADQIARASKLGDQAQGGIPGKSSPPGQPTGQTGQPQGGYQGGQEVPGARGPQQPGQEPGLLFPPYDPRSDPRGGGTKLGGNTPTKSDRPPTKVAQNPPASEARCREPLCYQAGQTGCEKGPLPQDPGWIPACYENMRARCIQGLAEAKAGRTGGTCVLPGADPSCEAHARQVCGGDLTGVGSKPASPSPSGATCGPMTSCKCAGGAKGHIPCDKSKGACHCGPG
jgi:hypothetical protein